MIDAIIYIQDFPTFVDYLATNYPDLLKKNEDGTIAQPPVVTGIARTPAAINGNSMLAYLRLTDEEATQWRGMEGVEVLAEAPFTGKGTADTLYSTIFNDTALNDKYESVYSTAPYMTDDGEGNQIQVTPPQRFGVIGGA